jgi:programmed cell death protein 5
MDELEALRQKKMQQLMQNQMQNQYQEQMQRAAQEQQMEEQLDTLMTQVLEPDAKARLVNIKFARPEFARQIEVLLLRLYQGGQLQRKLSDVEFKKILEKISGQKREPTIKRIEK